MAVLNTNRNLQGIASASPSAVGPYCRAGVAFTEPLAESQIDIGWEINFSISKGKLSQTTASNGSQYIPMIRLSPNSTSDYGLNSGYKIVNTSLSDDAGELGDLVRTYPGQLWIVGNEVDRKDVQDGLMPQTYADAYHDIYTFIKSRDPSAQIAFSGLVQVTPGRLQYLDIVWNAYKQKYGGEMPVDVWTFHVYPLPEIDYNLRTDSSAAVALGTDPNIAIQNSGGDSDRCAQSDVYCISEHDSIDIFKEHVVSMRQWMKNNGQQDKPLLLTEYGILLPYTYSDGAIFYDDFGNTFNPSRVTNFLNNSTSYLETATNTNLGYPADDYKLVQRWNWFRTYVADGAEQANGGRLVNIERTGLTEMGEAFRDRIAAQSLYVDLILEDVWGGVGFTSDGVTSDGEVTVGAKVRNVGTSRTGVDATLELRNSSNVVVATSTIPAPMQGCSTTVLNFDIDWNTAPTGFSDLTVHLVSSEDNNTTDNELSTSVFIDPSDQIFLPAVQR